MAVSLVSLQGDTKESEIAMTSTTLTRRARWLPGAAAVASILMVTAATPAHAADGGNNLVVAQTNLVANRAGFDALTVDPNLQNAWGMSKLPTSPVWAGAFQEST